MALSKKQILIIIPLILILAVLTYIGEPSKGPIFPCVFNKLTKLHCPGCGMTRALHSLMHLNFYQAMRYNMLIFIIPPLLGVYFFLKYKGQGTYAEKLMVITLILALFYGVFRNVPSLRLLQPTTIDLTDIYYIIL
ncbi:MAG TPA: DUF2752 domain-containing protein [Clostridia bacterium]|nr:DUF2752 domain-containing protein [Clostridia bacterium]